MTTMKNNRTKKIISMLIALISVIACCIVTVDGNPGVFTLLALINILSGDGKVMITDTSGYMGALLCFILPIVFIFVTIFARTKNIKIISFFLLLPLLFGAFNNIVSVYLIFAIIQIILWATIKE